MKKKSLKSLSLQKSNVATITGGLQDQQAANAISAICPSVTITIKTIHSLNPAVCVTRSCGTRCMSVCVTC